MKILKKEYRLGKWKVSEISEIEVHALARRYADVMADEFGDAAPWDIKIAKSYLKTKNPTIDAAAEVIAAGSGREIAIEF